jgi:DNA-3-methyladenine glycosylase II
MDGSLDFAQIGAMDDDAATLALQRQLGVGRWTAEYILLRGFGRLDVIPAGDAALKASVGAHLQLGRSATEAEVRALAEHWKPWRGETAFMLWFARQTGFLDG